MQVRTSDGRKWRSIGPSLLTCRRSVPNRTREAVRLRAGDMKSELGWNPKRANVAINLLEEEGKIERVPDEKDRRVVRLCPTEKWPAFGAYLTSFFKLDSR